MKRFTTAAIVALGVAAVAALVPTPPPVRAWQTDPLFEISPSSGEAGTFFNWTYEREEEGGGCDYALQLSWDGDYFLGGAQLVGTCRATGQAKAYESVYGAIGANGPHSVCARLVQRPDIPAVCLTYTITGPGAWITAPQPSSVVQSTPPPPPLTPVITPAPTPPPPTPAPISTATPSPTPSPSPSPTAAPKELSELAPPSPSSSEPALPAVAVRSVSYETILVATGAGAGVTAVGAGALFVRRRRTRRRANHIGP